MCWHKFSGFCLTEGGDCLACLCVPVLELIKLGPINESLGLLQVSGPVLTGDYRL